MPGSAWPTAGAAYSLFRAQGWALFPAEQCVTMWSLPRKGGTAQFTAALSWRSQTQPRTHGGVGRAGRRAWSNSPHSEAGREGWRFQAREREPPPSSGILVDDSRSQHDLMNQLWGPNSSRCARLEKSPNFSDHLAHHPEDAVRARWGDAVCEGLRRGLALTKRLTTGSGDC